MREILFRGKREDNGQWVIGFLSKTRGLDNKLHICIDYEEKGLMCSSIVIPSTIGQYTGLTDMNGKKIFEGDICAIVGEEKEIIKDDIFVVSWEENCGFNLYTCFDYEIIGNIYDNSELLKGVKNVQL